MRTGPIPSILSPMPGSFRAFLTFFFSTLALFSQDERPVAKDTELPPDQAASKALPTLWIAGDSTVRNSGAMRGWGEDIARFLDPAKIQVMNRAIGGRSSRTFFSEGRWDKMLAEMKPGDLVLVQFGHNDVGPLGAPGKFRGSIKGTGDETEVVEKSDGTKETVRSYGWYLRHFARTAKAKGTTVILCSPVPHKKFDREGKFVPDWTEWRAWVRSSAEAEGVHYLDLADLIGGAYAKMPAPQVEAFFADKGTHTNHEGALFNARQVIAGAKRLPASPLAPYLNSEGKAIPSAGS
jgi:rhamnogalacturonan acetylesterase